MLRGCTITGADDRVEPAALCAMSERFPLAEWAILYSPDRQGTERYPSASWRARFLRASVRERRAIHVCGAGVREFLQGVPALLDLVQPFGRVQLNFNITKTPLDLEKMAERVAALPQHTFILQHNKSNTGILASFRGLTNVEVLFDGSGGRGRTPSAWPSPLVEHVCGYAGGLGPLSLTGELPKIAAAAAGRVYWVDMESRVRDASDRLDLKAVEEALHLVASFSEPRTQAPRAAQAKLF